MKLLSVQYDKPKTLKPGSLSVLGNGKAISISATFYDCFRLHINIKTTDVT